MASETKNLWRLADSEQRSLLVDVAAIASQHAYNRAGGHDAGQASGIDVLTKMAVGLGIPDSETDFFVDAVMGRTQERNAKARGEP